MALRDQPYLPLYIQDIMTDEKLNECCAATHGIYIKGIMCLMHKSEEYGKILLKQKYKQTNNQNKNFALQLAKHLPYTVLEIEQALEELINEKVCYYENNYLCQKRMIKDNEISIIRANAGREGGIKTQKLAKANSEATSSANSENENEIENTINSALAANIAPEKQNGFITPSKFEDFWKAYPKKNDKGKALTKWNAICLKKNKDCPTWKEVKSAIVRQIKSERWQDEKFIPSPTTWLNQSRWLDDPEQMKVFKREDQSNTRMGGSQSDGSRVDYNKKAKQV